MDKIFKYIKPDKCFIIAEIGLSHDGSLGIATKMVDKCYKAGVDAIKFQTHIAEFESTTDEKFRTKDFFQDKNRFEYWKRTSFNSEQWLHLKNHVEKLNMVFISTPFSVEAAELLNDLEVNLWKISSGDLNNYPLLNFIKSTNKPFMLSTGMSNYNEISKTLKYLQVKNDEVLIFQCTNSYPCPPDELGLNQIKHLKNIYNLEVGLSDHSGNISSGIAAYTLGAKALEIHVTWDKDFFGPDVSASLTFNELKLLVDSIRFLEKAFQKEYNKNQLPLTHKSVRNNFMKGIYVNTDLKKGEIIKEEHLNIRKPCKGISVEQYYDVIGKKIQMDVTKGSYLTTNYFK